MKINYWNCPFSEYEEIGCGCDEEGFEIDINPHYGCTNEKNETHWCAIDNKWAEGEEDCEFLDEEGSKD